MNSKNGQAIEKTISIDADTLKEAVIAILEPIWRTTGVVKPSEEVDYIEFVNMEGLTNITQIPTKIYIQREEEAILETVDG